MLLVGDLYRDRADVEWGLQLAGAVGEPTRGGVTATDGDVSLDVAIEADAPVQMRREQSWHSLNDRADSERTHSRVLVRGHLRWLVATFRVAHVGRTTPDAGDERCLDVVRRYHASRTAGAGTVEQPAALVGPRR